MRKPLNSAANVFLVTSKKTDIDQQCLLVYVLNIGKPSSLENPKIQELLLY
jgi:hypothetical protein